MKNFEQKWENLTLADDFLFGKIMSESTLCAEMLRRIFPDLDIGEIKIIELKKHSSTLFILGAYVSIFLQVLYEIFLMLKLKTVC